MAFRHEQIDANGIGFHVAACGEGEDLALFLHGFPECWHSWRLQMPVLAELGYKAWAPDLRGYGDSDRPDRLQDYAIETLLDDVSALIDASGCKRVVLVGHDWGALIAWFFAMRRPQQIDRLVIMNVPHPGPFERAARAWAQMRKSWYVLFFQLPRLPEAMLRAGNYRAIRRAFVDSAIDKSRFPDEVLDIYCEAAAKPGALTAMLNYYRAMGRGGGAERQRELGYPMIEVPTLMIWGEEDIALTKQSTFGTDRYVTDLTLRYLPGVSHWVQQEAPEIVNAMLRSWLTGQSVPEAGDALAAREVVA